MRSSPWDPDSDHDHHRQEDMEASGTSKWRTHDAQMIATVSVDRARDEKSATWSLPASLDDVEVRMTGNLQVKIKSG